MNSFHRMTAADIRQLRKQIVRRTCLHIAIQSLAAIAFVAAAGLTEELLPGKQAEAHVWIAILAGIGLWGGLVFIPVLRHVFLPLRQYWNQALERYLEQLPVCRMLAGSIKAYEAYDVPGLDADVVCQDEHGHELRIDAALHILPDDALPSYYLEFRGTTETIKHPFTAEVIASPEQPLIRSAVFHIKRRYLTPPGWDPAGSE